MPIISISSVPSDIVDRSVIVLDLGFSEKKPSVGIASAGIPSLKEPEPLSFGDAIVRLNEALSDLARTGMTSCVLAIEAPLSIALTTAGAPCHRNFELQKHFKVGPASPKGWFYQAGANLTLGSTVLLRALNVPPGFTVHLCEAFYCAHEPGEVHPADEKVAAQLLAHLLASPGLALKEPKPDAPGGRIEVLPGLEGLIQDPPFVLLRKELELISA